MSDPYRPGEPPDPTGFVDWRGYARALADYTKRELGELQRLSDLRDRALPRKYTTSNVTADRTFDADATTVAELADVLGTLIADLAERGIVRTRGN